MDYFMVAVFGFLFGMFSGLFVAFTDVTIIWQEDLVNRELAIYCPTDAKFAFNGECDK